jgi:23S rRNA (uracil1939-C5)-methyltransferase
VDAPCVHYGACGGCNLQHVSPDTYARSKREWVIVALARQGLNPPVDELVRVSSGTRRRAVFAATGQTEGVMIGFHRARSHEIVEVPHCLIVRPRMMKALAAMRGILSERLGTGREARITITEADNGIDVAIDARGMKVQALSVPEIETARLAFVIRATWNGELLFATDRVRLTVGGARVDLPSGAFIQAVKASEEALAARVAKALSGAKRVADLYAGIGTFTFALAQAAAVEAFDGDAPLVDALSTAARRAQGLKPVSAQVRDLAKRPLMAAELGAFDAVVLDPPRIGAEAQVRQLAISSAERIAYVSCNPTSFARDARILCGGGFALERVTPVDQFLWSHHVELVGTLARR